MHPLRFKVKAVAFMKMICADGKPAGNNGAAVVLGVVRKRMITWVSYEENMRDKLNTKPTFRRLLERFTLGLQLRRLALTKSWRTTSMSNVRHTAPAKAGRS